MDSLSDAAILADTAVFLGRGTVNQKMQLRKFLVAQPSFITPSSLIPIEELTTRLDIIEDIRTFWEQCKSEDEDRPKAFHLSYIQVSTLLLMPLNALQGLRGQILSIEKVLNPPDIMEMLSLMVQGKLPAPTAGTKRARSKGTSEGSANSAKSSYRNTREREKCCLRDQKACILTKAASPQACHVIPYAVTANHTNIDAYMKNNVVQGLLGNPGEQIARIIKKGSLSSLDKSWNMICLHPTLHTWWSQCLFSLKCLGLIPQGDGRSTRVQIQFYWMPRNGINPHELVKPPYETAISEMLQTVTLQHGGGIGIVADVQRDSFHALETGQTFDIVADNEDAVKLKEALDVQWAIVRLAAMSGAAGVLALEDNSDKDDDAMVTEWLEKTASAQSSSR
ncbi:hypothetical protein V8C40DRAFT_279715 [Trichoderma camerunense]